MCKSRTNANAGLQPKQGREIIWEMSKHLVSTFIFFQNKVCFLKIFISKQVFLFEQCCKPKGEERLKRCKGKETLWIWLEGCFRLG